MNLSNIWTNFNDIATYSIGTATARVRTLYHLFWESNMGSAQNCDVPTISFKLGPTIFLTTEGGAALYY